MEGRAVWIVVVFALVLAAGGAWSALRWDELQVIDAAADLSPDDDGSLTGTTVPPAPEPPGGGTTTTLGTTTTASSVPAQAAECTIADDDAVGDPATDWATIVVDAGRALPSSYEPPDLVDAEAAGFDTGDMIREIIVDDLDALRAAAEENDTPLGLISAYRSFSYQQGLYDRAVEREGEAEAQKGTARPGHSEHQLGTSVDLLEAGSQSLVPEFADTPTGQWLAENAHLYGFIISYPDLPPTRTCYEYEPWHLRYVGRELAPTIRDSGMAPREWMLSQPPAAP